MSAAAAEAPASVLTKRLRFGMVFTGALITRPIRRVNVVGIGRSVRLQADVPGRLTSLRQGFGGPP